MKLNLYEKQPERHSQMKLNPDLVRKRCGEISDSLARLEKIGRMSKEAFLKDQDARDIASYRLLVAIEVSLSLCYHISSKQLSKVPENYAECFLLLGEAGVISADLSNNLQKMARFRNPLVHVYWEIEEEALYSVITGHLDDLRKYCAAVARLL
jgi:uncharacterized protein YutE (UPF0331/DUF86 family)